MRTLAILLSMLCLFWLGMDVAYAPTNAATRPTSVSDQSKLRNPKWIADPVNYEQTKTMTINTHVSVPILEYHEAKYTPGNVITLKPGQFAAEMEWLHRHGFHTINFGQLYAAMYYGYKLPSRPVLLTFDDGYESVYFNVFPILKKYGYQATVFVISGDVHDEPNRSVKYPKLTTDELKIMQQSGVFDIESHTVHHVDLSTVSSTVANEELRGMQKWCAGTRHACTPFSLNIPGAIRYAPVSLSSCTFITAAAITGIIMRIKPMICQYDGLPLTVNTKPTTRMAARPINFPSTISPPCSDTLNVSLQMAPSQAANERRGNGSCL
jgi:hypothetical protein